jgi:haloacetate dehalogenase
MRETAVVDGGVRIRYRRAGSGPLLVLVHGWPQTSACWRHLIGPLSSSYTVVAPDLRGYGASSKPAVGYDKRSMAGDLHDLVHQLGFESAAVVGHDRGARVAHRWALDHPSDVSRLVLLDIIPTREMWLRMDASLARSCFHWLMHLQPAAADFLSPEPYLRHIFDSWAHVPLPSSSVEEYIRAFTAPGAFRVSLADYSAAFPFDAEADEESFGRLLPMPVRLLWGSHSFLQDMDPVAIWRSYAEDVAGQVIPDCGHFLAEERPAETLAALRKSLSDES